MFIQTGHKVTADAKTVKGKAVSFCTDDGRVMFEVRILSDGKGLEIRGVEDTKHGDVVHSNMLIVKPRYSNTIDVYTDVYFK